MEKIIRFQIAKGQPQGVPSLLLNFFANFSLVLLIKKACNKFCWRLKSQKVNKESQKVCFKSIQQMARRKSSLLCLIAGGPNKIHHRGKILRFLKMVGGGGGGRRVFWGHFLIITKWTWGVCSQNFRPTLQLGIKE